MNDLEQSVDDYVNLKHAATQAAEKLSHIYDTRIPAAAMMLIHEAQKLLLDATKD